MFQQPPNGVLSMIWHHWHEEHGFDPSKAECLPGWPDIYHDTTPEDAVEIKIYSTVTNALFESPNF